MIRNYYYLIVGLLCVLFAVTHTINGIETSLLTLENAQFENNAKVAFTYVWHIIGAENLVFGIALLIMACQKNQSQLKFVAWLIVVILAMRWIVIVYVTVFNKGNAMQLIPDTIAIFMVIILLFLGTKVKEQL